MVIDLILSASMLLVEVAIAWFLGKKRFFGS
jgi:hypothetical protein